MLNQVHLSNPGLGWKARYGGRRRSWRLRPHASHTGGHHHDQDQDHRAQEHHVIIHPYDHKTLHEIKWFTGSVVRPGLGEGHCQGEVLLIASTSEQSPPTEPPISTFLKLFHPNTFLAGCFLSHLNMGTSNPLAPSSHPKTILVSPCTILFCRCIVGHVKLCRCCLMCCLICRSFVFA